MEGSNPTSRQCEVFDSTGNKQANTVAKNTRIHNNNELTTLPWLLLSVKPSPSQPAKHEFLTNNSNSTLYASFRCVNTVISERLTPATGFKRPAGGPNNVGAPKTRNSAIVGNNTKDLKE
ncbi:hypothetical protein FRC12_023642 [Ceratobasidium sp. 428]|nr:hypothetical protein FRC12_023642 [Ceratobasidium sp. 428]